MFLFCKVVNFEFHDISIVEKTQEKEIFCMLVKSVNFLLCFDRSPDTCHTFPTWAISSTLNPITSCADLVGSSVTFCLAIISSSILYSLVTVRCVGARKKRGDKTVHTTTKNSGSLKISSLPELETDLDPHLLTFPLK